MRIFLVCLCAWFVAQLIKVILNAIKYFIDKKNGDKAKKVTISTLFKLGGMPSSHTATVIALGTCVGCLEGWDSTVFAVAGVFAFITMFDAIKVRLPMESLTDEFISLRQIVMESIKDMESLKKLKRVEGHTLPEVVGGFIVGAGVALLILKFTPLFPEYVSIFETLFKLKF